MKKIGFLAALALLFACTPESNPGNGGNNNNGGGNTQPTVIELTGIALTEHEITLEKGGNKVLEVKFTPENASNKTLTWVSSNTSIVTVTDGVVVGVAPGTTEIVVKSGNLTDKCQVTVVISATSVSLDQTELTLTLGEMATLKAIVLPEDSTDEVEWSSSDETVATVKDGEVTAVAVGETTITAKAGDKTATCSVKVDKVKAVDLGLPSGLKWAECNLGAEKPEDYGDYYAWGEVEPYYSSQDPLTWKEGKTGYDRASYKWCNGNYGSNYGKLTKYCPTDMTSYWDGEGSPDNKAVLDPEDDAAHVSLGGKWRMPTYEEWRELLTECTWTRTTQNDVNGRLVTGKNGNSIFLPAAGDREYTNLYNVNNGGDEGGYWSSSLNTDNPFGARYVCFFQPASGSQGFWNPGSLRYYGKSIRPVSE